MLVKRCTNDVLAFFPDVNGAAIRVATGVLNGLGTAGERVGRSVANMVLFWLFTVSKRPSAGLAVVAMPGMVRAAADTEDAADGVPGRELGNVFAESG